MLDCLKAINWKKTGLFAAGVAFGTAGIKILSSDDAKNVYSNCTAAVLRAKDCVMNVVSTVQENAEDIYAEAVEINEEELQKKNALKMKQKILKKLTMKQKVQTQRQQQTQSS